MSKHNLARNIGQRNPFLTLSLLLSKKKIICFQFHFYQIPCFLEAFYHNITDNISE